MNPLKLVLSVSLLLSAQDGPKNADLVAHLTFDDETARTADASGHNHAGKAVGTVAWGEGKKGGALRLDGAGGHVEIPNAPALENVQEGSYTLAAWFQPAAVPPGRDSDNTAAFGILVKAGWHNGLKYTNEKQFVMEHWLAPAAGGEEPVWAGAGTWEDSFDAGAWYHLAGVVDRKAGTSKLYLNGELKNAAEWEAGKVAREAGQTPWRIGIASPGAEKWAWPAKGLIDDVRLYRKALGDVEIEGLFKETSK